MDLKKYFNNKTVFFSVIIPTYNQGSLLKRAISSVLSQTFQDYEIIVVDDLSKDQTQKIVQEFNNDKIIYKKMNNNKNIGKSRNEGIRLSKGQWIAFLDSDDLWYPKRLKIVSDFLTNNSTYDALCTDDLIIDKIRSRKKIWKYGPYTKNFYETLLKNGNCITTSATVVKKDFLLSHKIQFNEDNEFFTAEDYDFFMRIALANAKFKFLRQVLGEHLFYKNSSSANYLLHKEAIMSVVKYHVFNVQKFTKNKEKLWRKIKINFRFKDAVYLFANQKKYIQSLMHIFKTFLLSPVQTSFLILRKLKKFLF